MTRPSDDYTDPRQDEAQWTGSDRDAEREPGRGHSTLQHIPLIRWTQAEILEAERHVIIAFKSLYGHLAEPGAVWTRDAALRYLADKAGK